MLVPVRLQPTLPYTSLSMHPHHWSCKLSYCLGIILLHFLFQELGQRFLEWEPTIYSFILHSYHIIMDLSPTQYNMDSAKVSSLCGPRHGTFQKPDMNKCPYLIHVSHCARACVHTQTRACVHLCAVCTHS